MRKVVLLLLASLLWTGPAWAEVTAVRFSRLITMRGAPVTDAVVVVEDGRIRAVGQGEDAVPPGATVIDLRPLTGLPGLIDVHTHMSYYWDPATAPRPWSAPAVSTPVLVFLAQQNVRRTLESGVTTVRDMGGIDYGDIALRDLINRGALVGPRMLVAGAGLHASTYPLRLGYAEPDPGRTDGVEGVLFTARQSLAAGADWLKMYGSTGSADDATGFQTFTLDEMRAAVAVAHQAGKRIAIHTYGAEAARSAVAAGADSLEHGAYMDEETIAAMARQGIYLVPTIDHNRVYIEHREEYGYDDAAVERIESVRLDGIEILRKAMRAGVPIAMGSDAVFVGFGENARELEVFVEAGMRPEEALRTATLNGAELLKMEGEVGAVDAGYFADLIAVDGDPLTDIQAVTRRVRWVMKGGAVVVDRHSEEDSMQQTTESGAVGTKGTGSAG